MLSVYDVDGSFLSACTLESTYTAAVWSEADGGYYLTAVDQTGHDQLYFWDLGVPVGGEDLTLEPIYGEILSTEAVSQELYDRAADLSARYGISVRIAEQIDTVYRDFEVEQEVEESVISDGLDAVEQVLGLLPENFLPQLRYGTQQSLEIHLSGNLTKRDQPENISGFSSFSGLTEVRETETVVVLDVARPGSVAQTLCHELMHVLEGKLKFHAWLQENAVYDEEMWLTLNPEGFVYAETYDEMPMSYFTDGYESWFVDLYSRTYAKEDRARILEHAMMGNAWVFSGSPQRMAKLEYLCRCIRDAFDTTGWPDQTVWEEVLS